MEFPKDSLFQIILFLIGIVCAIVIPKLKEKWQKNIATIISILLLLGAVFWAGYELGNQARYTTGIKVPIQDWTISGATNGTSTTTGDEKTGDFELSSLQTENSYTSPQKQLIYTWVSPGNSSFLNSEPMSGIEATIKISPNEAPDEHQLVFCYYSLVYNSYQYNSAAQFIPFNQPKTMVWDFVGIVEPTEFAISAENKLAITNGTNALSSETDLLSFTYYFRKLREVWQYGKMVTNSYDPNQIQNLQMICNVSATRDYVGGNSGDQFMFNGNFTFGDVIVYPFERP